MSATDRVGFDGARPLFPGVGPFMTEVPPELDDGFVILARSDNGFVELSVFLGEDGEDERFLVLPLCGTAAKYLVEANRVLSFVFAGGFAVPRAELKRLGFQTR